MGKRPLKKKACLVARRLPGHPHPAGRSLHLRQRTRLHRAHKILAILRREGVINAIWTFPLTKKNIEIVVPGEGAVQPGDGLHRRLSDLRPGRGERHATGGP